MYPKPLIGGAAILSVFTLFLTLLHGIPWGSLIGFIGQTTINFVLQAGWCYMCLRLVRGDTAGSLDIFDGFSRFIPVWLTFLLLVLIMTGGFILLVVPGIILGLKYGMSIFAIMDRSLSARESIRFSGKITKGYKGKIFVLFIISLTLNLLAYPFYMGLNRPGHAFNPTLVTAGLAPLLVDVLVIIPFLTAAFAAAYDSLVHREEIAGTPLAAQSTAAQLSQVSPEGTPSSLPSTPS